jgi:hypothetical protein
MEKIPGFVYCGRAAYGYRRSPLANQYKVGVYHDLFYDVRPHLGNAAVIARLALGWSPDSSGTDQIGALRLFGYSPGRSCNHEE